MHHRLPPSLRLALLFTVSAIPVASLHAAEPDRLPSQLPEGPGIAQHHPGDQGIRSHPAVLLAEDFESGSIEDLALRWESVSNAGSSVLAWSPLHPDASPGNRSLQFTATVPDNTGGHLYRRLPRAVDRAFARFYVRFDPANDFTHHFVTLGGYNPATSWPQGGAGTRPVGNERFTVGIEPTGDNGRHPPPGAWFFYAYWAEMKGSADGRFWGNGLRPALSQPVPSGRWQCVEYMIQLNKPAQSDGELALWLDGSLVAHFAPGSRRTPWSGMGFQLTDDPDAPVFEGFKWRTDPALQINFFWLLHFVTEAANRQHRVATPNPVNRVWFDHIVVAESYIGPIHPLP